ncbi:MAG: hypothetical protein ACXU8S_02915 [Phenylobacterium sp.]
MTVRRPALARWLAAGFCLAALGLASGAGAAGYKVPRTPWGAPNLQGTWNNFSLTRLERAPGVPARVTADSDLKAIEKLVYDSILPADPLDSRNSEWWEAGHLARMDGQLRTAWITSPADGRIPYTDEARKKLAAERAKAFVDYDGPESRNTSERCMLPTFGAGSPPMQNAPYASNYLIVQTREAVVLVSEIDDEVRIIRLNAAHPSGGLRVWNGDSIGHWEKDTLVVETTGFHPQETFRAPVYLFSPDARVIERFTRVSPTEIRYAFSVEAPTTYTQVWTGEMPFHASTQPMYEYACHEGNNSLPGMLQGARYMEAHPEPPAAPRPAAP